MDSAIPTPVSPYKDKGEFVGEAFHATSQESGSAIIAGKQFHLPVKATMDQRMGRGVYFWDSSLEAAKKWADDFYSDGPRCAIQAKVKLGRSMNMEVPEHQEAFALIAERLRKEEGQDQIYDAQVYNFFVYKGWIETARKIHRWRYAAKVFPTSSQSWVEKGTCMMICVYITKLIEAPCIVWSKD